MAKTINGLNIPAFDIEAAVALQRANFETLMQAHDLLADAARKAFAVQTEWANKVIANGQRAFEIKKPMKPEAYIGEAEAMAKEAVEIAQSNVNLGVQTQRQVSDLVAKRFAANIEEMKKHAA